MMMLLEYMRTVCGGHVASWDSSIQIEHLVLAFGALLAGEWIVYIVHRAMHRNPTLAYFHQVHHQPLKSAAHALYASLGEVAILNVGAYALPLMLFGGHAKIIFLLETMGTVMAVLTHAGGSKGWAWSHGHDLHHRNPRYNFSTFLLADYVHGTFRSCSHVIAPKRVSTSIEELRKTFSEQRKRRKVVHQP
jgi:sterol desaturase/sphingolipid hydroxylase (fatty acid hydroxylase superfamily)